MEVRCVNPKCGKLIANHLEGLLRFKCPRCGVWQEVVLDKATIMGVQVTQ